MDDIKMDDKLYIIYRNKNGIKLSSNYSKLRDSKEKAIKQLIEENSSEVTDFSIVAFLMIGKNGYRISSINHYDIYFKHQEILKEKYEDLNYKDYGRQKYLDDVGYDKYCNNIWKVARDPKTLHNIKYKIKDKGEYLGEHIQQGDIIKIGRIKFRLRKFNLSSNGSPFVAARPNSVASPEKSQAAGAARTSNLVNKNYKKEVNVEQNEEIPPCRFCLSNEMDTDTNPLINPCMCKGTMGFLHIDCMKHWLNTKKTVKDYNENTCIIYTWKIISCELCKSPYPHTIHFKDKSVCILEYDEPENEPYIIFESYPKEGSKNETQKSIYVCKIRNKKLVKMGRAQQNELRIHDISISRNHAEIVIKDTKLYIRDKKSKFGTLLLMKAPEDISTTPDSIVTYQIGRTVLIFNAQDKSSLCANL
jgi:hypothetical protein